jgi:hypothetical protein
MVKAHDTVPRATSGYHGGKKITSRGRHVAVDIEGWLLALVVTAASVSDKAGAKLLLICLFDAFSTLKVSGPTPGTTVPRSPGTPGPSPRSPSRSSPAPARTPSRSCAAAGSSSAPSAG